MIGHCINTESNDYKTLLQETGFSTIVLSAKIARYQQIHGLDSYPTSQEIKEGTLEVKIPVKKVIEDFVERAGIDVNVINDTMIDNNIVESKIADMFYNFIKTSEGKQDYKSLPDEVGSLTFNIMKDSRPVELLMGLIDKTAVYKEFSDLNSIKYNDNIEDIKRHACEALITKYGIRNEDSIESNETLYNKVSALARNIIKLSGEKFTNSMDPSLMNDINVSFKLHPAFNTEVQKDVLYEEKVRAYNKLVDEATGSLKSTDNRYKFKKVYHADQIAYYERTFDNIIVTDSFTKGVRHWLIQIPNPNKDLFREEKLEITEKDKKMIESNKLLLTGMDYIDKYVKRWGYEILRLRNAITPANKEKTQAKIFQIESRIKELIASPENNIPVIIRTANEQLTQIENLIRDFHTDKVKGHESEFYAASSEYLIGWLDIVENFRVVEEYKFNEEKMAEFSAIAQRARNAKYDFDNLYQMYVIDTFNSDESSAPFEDLFSPQVQTSMLESLLLDISTSKLPLLRKIYSYVNRAILTSRLEASVKAEEIDDKTKDLMDWAERTGKSKKDVWEYFKQKDEAGKLTGRYVTKYKIDYERAFKEAKDKNAFLQKNAVWTIDTKAWEKAQEVMKKEFGEESRLYWEWFNNNNPNGQATGGAQYGKWIPKDNWIDPKYNVIQKTKELKDFYDFFTEEIQERSHILPLKPKDGMLPEMKSGFLLDMAKYGTKDFYKGLGPAFKDIFKVKIEGVVDKRDRDSESNLPRKNIPVYMMGNTMTAEEKSYDLGEVLKTYSAMSYLYEYRAKVEEPVIIARNQFKEVLEQQIVSGTDIQKKGIFGELLSKMGVEKNKSALAQLNYYIDAMIYDVRKEPILVTKPNEKGEAYSFDKVLNGLNKLTRLKGLAFNPFSAVTNLLFGITTNITHAAGEEDYTRSDAFWGLSKMLTALSRPEEMKKIRLLLNRYELPRDYSDKTAIGSVFNEKIEKGLMVFQTKTEEINQGMMVLAKLNHIKVSTKSGEVSLFDCYKVAKTKGGKSKLVWDTEKYGEEQYDLTTKEGFQLYENMQQLSKNLHGNYDPSSPIRAKSNDYGQALMIFRSWIPQTFMNRFGSERYDERLGRTFKGRYRSMGTMYKASGSWGRFLADLSGQVISMHTLGLIKNNSYSKLENEVDVANMKKNVQEMILLLDLYLLGLLLAGFEPEKKDKKWKTIYNFTLLQIMRTKQDMTFFVSPESQSSIVQNVSPTVKTITDAMAIPSAVYKLMIGEDEIQAGYNKGRSNLLRKINKFLPVTAPIQRMFELGDITDVETRKR